MVIQIVAPKMPSVLDLLYTGRIRAVSDFLVCSLWSL